MPLTITAGPSTEPLTTAEAKTHLRVDTDDDNDYIDSLVKAARRWVEQVTWRQLITATYVLRLDRFCGSVIYIPRPPLKTFTSFQYLDLDGVLQTWSSGNYEVDLYSSPGRVRPIATGYWPTVGNYYQNAITITYDAGYGAASAVPDDIKHAMRLMVGHWYRQREAVGANMAEVPLAVHHLIAPYRVHDERAQEWVA